MSLFFTFKAPAPQKASVYALEWHNTLPLLAVSVGDFDMMGSVLIYGEEGEQVGSIDCQSTDDRFTSSETMAWHPSVKFLVTGWKDGGILTWDGSLTTPPEEVATTHKDKQVKVLRWNENGDKLLSADSQGGWTVWKYERKQLRQLQRSKDNFDGSLTHCTFRCRPGVRKDSADEQGDHRLLLEDEEEPGLDQAAAPAAAGFTVANFNAHCTWFVGGTSGTVWGVDDEGCTGLVFNVDNLPLVSLLYYPAKSGVIAMNQVCSVCFYCMRDDSKWFQQARFRVSLGKGAATASAQMSWIGNGLAATIAHENMVRVWMVDANDTYVLRPQTSVESIAAQDNILALAYNSQKRTLALGTRAGFILFYQYTGRETSVSEDDWSLYSEVRLDSMVSIVQWGPGDALLASAQTDTVTFLHGTSLHRCLHKNSVVVQLTADTLLYEDLGAKTALTTRISSVRVQGMALAGTHFAVWNAKQVELFRVRVYEIASVGVHNIENTGVALHADKLMVMRTEKGVSSIEMYNLQLQKLSNLSIKAHEGEACFMHVKGDFLVAATSKNYINCWWVGGRAGDERAHGYPKMLWEDEAAEKSRQIAAVAVNVNGSQVAVLSQASTAGNPAAQCSEVLLCNIEHDGIATYDFEQHGRLPTTILWDENEPRLLCCETKRTKRADDEDANAIEVFTLFCSTKGVKLQERFILKKGMTALVGISVPHFYIYQRETLPVVDPKETKTTNILQRVMRDFDGIDCSDIRVKEALLEFSYNLACGDMDAAYRSVKLIKDENVWTNMAQMCVKTGRLDVAEVCLGNMQDAKGAKFLREARKEPETDAHVAMLALQLGLVDDAERLYKKCQRHDLLNVMYQACGQWDKAIKLAEDEDRIHLRTIHYEYARHLESIGDFTAAVAQYEKAKCHGYEVPRMLYNAGRLEQLEQYANSSADRELLLWWAQFCESNTKYEQALHFYKEAGDTVSLVRLHCLLQDLDGAAHIVEKAKDAPAAAYHLAKQYEEAGKIRETLHFFRLAKAYKNAIRIARSNGMDAEVMQLSLQADPATIVESATWFEEHNSLDKAVVLYKKGGELGKAIDLCVRGELFDTLQKLADDLDKDTDPDVFIQCAEFFLSKNQNEKAVNMYVQAKSYTEALQVCLDRDVKLTEDMAEDMTLPKTDNEDDEALRLHLLRKIAKVAKLQESWHLACKKYTQAGDRVKGMKVLLKSGDTDKIIFFTNHSRQKDIYILAAHYLQTSDWHTNPTITKHIITFYTKARAYESLSGFYDAIAQVYIDEFRDYDKALVALQDSAKYMDKSKAQNRDLKMQQLEAKINFVEQFVEGRNMVKSDPTRMVEICKELLDVEDIEGAVRVGDVYALLVEFYTGRQEFENAYNYIERMRDGHIILSYYLEPALVQAVYKAMGIEYKEQEHAAQSHQAAPQQNLTDDVEDEIEEDIGPDD